MTVHDLPEGVRETAHVDVPMPDGCRLGARIWRPEGAEAAPVPAILEYIPYRKNDLCSPEDRSTGTWLAARGYAYVRLDVRGAGDSEGLMPDEYTARELQDGCDAIAWIAGQDWCSGAVGMIGISWGGFNGLQVAALRPPALKAVITVCSTDDRYADDIHYMGGCFLIDQISWAGQMFARNSLPPDPENRGVAWRDLWHRRLEESGLWLKNWLEHQTRDGFWRHGSICENYADIEVPVYAVSGWADGYCRAVFRLCEHLPGPRKGLIGPWAHKYPHVGVPGPAIGWLQETKRWWDHWLKGEDTGIMEEPMLRLFMQDHAPPAGWYGAREGRWVAEPAWPSPNVAVRPFHLGAGGRLGEAPAPEAAPVEIASPLFSAAAAGKWCSYAVPGDQPVDQYIDDGAALVFETDPLPEALEIAGAATVVLGVAADRPVAQVAARLVDVAPDGRSTRVCYGVLNLTHRDGHAAPEPLEPGRFYTVRVPLKTVAQRFRAGHRIRLALSSTYFPLIWPAPAPARLRVLLAESRLDLPVRSPAPADAALAPFEAPEFGTDTAVERLEPAGSGWRQVNDLGTGERALEVTDGSGVYRLVDAGLTVTKQARERYACIEGEPGSETAQTTWTMGLERGDWRVRTLTETTLTASPETFRIDARLRAWEGEALVFERAWAETLPRVLV